jgi:acetoin utilization protein AcuB
MTKQVEMIPSVVTAGEALARMRQQRIRHLVVTEGGKLVGVLSDRDLENLASMAEIETAGERMSRPVVTAGPDTTVRKAANLLRGRSIGCLPVVQRGKLLGIVTTTDLLELIGRGVERPATKSRRWTLKDRGGARRPIPRHAALRSQALR